MQSTQSRIIVIVLIALAVVGGGAYFYATQKAHITVVDNQFDTSTISSSTTSNTVTSAAGSERAGLSDIVQLSVNPPLEQAKISKGVYGYEEFARGDPGSNQTWDYDLNISTNGGVGPISLSIDGFQTLTRINAYGIIKEGSLQVVFDSYGTENTQEYAKFKKGDILFTLKPRHEGTSIEWKAMQPMLNWNKKGAIFRKF